VTETVVISAEVRDENDTLVDPTNIILTLKDPNGVAVFTEQDMTKTDIGKYVYYWTSSADSTLGWYRTIVKATDGAGAGAKVTVAVGGFYLQ
jgi:hypothetical protein